MTNKNDKSILKFKDKIKSQKKLINQKFVPKTNCMLNFRGSRYNLHALDMNTCGLLIIELNALLTSAKMLNLEDTKISNFTLEEWLKDLKSKYLVLKNINEKIKNYPLP